jgi:protein associated with RNAse G/E
MWKPGDHVLLRGIYNNHVWIAQSSIVVKDDPAEVALALLPGAGCAVPEGYLNRKHGTGGKWSRWDDYLNDRRDMQEFNWHTNRLLLLMEPESYYGAVYFWNHASNEFLCYYINFQLPFTRTAHGFDTLDLELDIVIEPSYEWQWKDAEEYQEGIAKGVFQPQWIEKIDQAKAEVFQKLESKAYPFDGSWLNWMPDPRWSPPKLPEDWDKL